MAPPARSSALPGLLLAAALLTSLPILWIYAVPVLTLAAMSDHPAHEGVILAHVLGGIAMIGLGAAALFVGWTRRGFKRHKLLGYGYLGLGGIGALTALGLSILAPHEPKSLYVATGTLSAAWLGVAAMAWRSARNRRFDTHRQWMVRSYVLSWTFVGCRIAGSFSLFPGLGAEGVTATIWVNWIVPLLICEIALAWTATAPVSPRAPTRAPGATLLP